jgi:hypothetical protein
MAKSKTMRWAGNVARRGEKVHIYMVLLREPEVTRLYLEELGVDGDNIKMHNKEMRWFALHSSVVGCYIDR